MNRLFKKIFVIILIIFCNAALFAKGQVIKAEYGFIDLSEIDLSTFKSASLNGEWLFFADTLINPQNIEKAFLELPHTVITVPSKRSETKSFKYGTYYLKVNLDTTKTELTISSLTIYSAASIYVNNKLVGSVGTPTQSIKTTKPGLILNWKSFYPKIENHIVIHYANFYREKNGLANKLYLTTPAHQIKQSAFGLLKYAIIIGTILFIIFNQINYFLISRKNRTSFYFGIASIMIAIYVIFMSFYYFGALFPNFNPDFIFALKIWRFSYYMTVCFFAIYVYSLFPSIYSKYVLFGTIGYTSFSALLTFFTPLHISSINFNGFMFFTIFSGVYGVYAGIVAKIRQIDNAGLFLLGFGFLIVTVVNDTLHNLLVIHSVNLLDIGIFGMMLIQAQIINSKLNQSLLKSENLSEHLQYVNTNLESIVHQRTKEIEEQKTEIEAQRDYALSQHKLITKQKKTITDSINYAREIQQAVLPDEEILKNCFGDSFILFKPKDYVSGDFYWIRNLEINNTPHMLFCVADCTGHGVPGALLSMLGMSLLGEIISHNSINKASDVLELLRTKFKNTLYAQTKRESTSDGMYISLCIVNKDTKVMQYSGAFQSLFHIRDNKVKKIKGSNCIVGNYLHEIPYENHTIQLKTNDRLYLFTDGFADQMSESGQGKFMQKRLVNRLLSFNNIPYEKQRNLLAEEFESWKGSYEQIDDVLVMGVKV